MTAAAAAVIYIAVFTIAATGCTAEQQRATQTGRCRRWNTQAANCAQKRRREHARLSLVRVNNASNLHIRAAHKIKIVVRAPLTKAVRVEVLSIKKVAVA